MTPRGATFELERFESSPITAHVTLLEVEGRLAGSPGRAQAPRMLVEPAYGARREHAPVEAATRDGRLRVSFAVPIEEIEAAALALAVGGLLLDLPAPDPVAAADRTIALAREANGLRHELAALGEEAAVGREAVSRHAEELERQELALAEREAAAERRADQREAAADQVAIERIAEAERAAGERQAEFARAAAKRQGDLEREVTELGRVLSEVRAVTEQRDAAAAAERAHLEGERDAARGEAAAAARAAELPAEATTGGLPAEKATTVERPEAATTAQRPADQDATPKHPTAEKPAAPVRSPDDTGPTPLIRGPVRRGPAAPTGEGRRDRPRASALPPSPESDPGQAPGPSTRMLALAALAFAALLVVIAILGFVL